MRGQRGDDNCLRVGAVVRARVGSSPVQLVRVDDTPFSARLVRKFNLPVRGWRDGPR